MVSEKDITNTSHSHSELLTQIRVLLEESEEKSRRLMVLTNLSVDIHQAKDLDAVFTLLKHKMPLLIASEHASIFSLNTYGMWETRTLYDGQDNSYQFKIDNPTLSQVISHRKSLMIDYPTPSLLPDYLYKLIIPLNYKDNALGTIQFARSTPFDYEDLRLGILLGFQISSIIDKFNQMQILIITQQQLSDYAQELVAQNEDIETYNYTIAHDLKSPLSVIPLKVSMIRQTEKSLKPSTYKFLDDIEKRIYSMSNMIEQLLLLSTLRENTQTMNLLDVNQVIDSIFERFVEIELGQVKVVVQPDLPSVMGHAQWLEEVFANLISNAIKYMGDNNPKPTIHITATSTDTDVTFRVTDNGIGIRTQDQEALFKMFTRIKDVEAEGLGLGLAIVHRIIQKLDGQLGVESQWGHGTTFWLKFPVFKVKRFQ